MPSLTEHRIRVATYFPVNTTAERKAFSRVLTYLQGQLDDTLGVTGYTQADNLLGWWWDEEFGWIEDRITIVTIDLLGDERGELFGHALVTLKHYVLATYQATGAYQKEIWLTTHRINRYL